MNLPTRLTQGPYRTGCWTTGRVAGSSAAIGDADERLAGLQLLAGEAVVEIALQVERGHAGILRVVEPEGGAAGRFGHVRISQAGALREGCSGADVSDVRHPVSQRWLIQNGACDILYNVLFSNQEFIIME
jgi:hypothetical protein